MKYDEIITLLYNSRKLAPDNRLKFYSNLKTRAEIIKETSATICEYLEKGLKELEPEAEVVWGESAENAKGKRFILDPVNGDINLARGYNMTTCSIAYAEGNDILFGVVYNPYSEEMFIAMKGLGAHSYNTKFGLTALLKRGAECYRDNELRVSEVKPCDAIMEFGGNFIDRENAEKSFDLLKKIFQSSMDIRRISSPALTICNVAAGRIDGYFERFVNCHTFAAAALVLTEAGGRISKWDGSKLKPNEKADIICGNPAVYKFLK